MLNVWVKAHSTHTQRRKKMEATSGEQGWGDRCWWSAWDHTERKRPIPWFILSTSQQEYEATEARRVGWRVKGVWDKWRGGSCFMAWMAFWRGHRGCTCTGTGTQRTRVHYKQHPRTRVHHKQEKLKTQTPQGTLCLVLSNHKPKLGHCLHWSERFRLEHPLTKVLLLI